MNFTSKKEVKDALKAARAVLKAANRSGDRIKIQAALKTCEHLRDVLDSWK